VTQSNSDRIEEIFHAALALPESERSAFVVNECTNDPDCVSEVNSLLQAAARSGFLDVPVVPLGEGDSLVGRIIDGRYEIESELPHGAMAKVYLARHLELLGKFVVIKVLYRASTNDRELQALTLLRHPGVVTVFGAGQVDGNAYIAMEYIDGPTLRSEIENTTIELRRAAALIKQIGAAVGHVHNKGILHRDLKPENILLQLLTDGTEEVKIVDFGIAKIKESVSAAGVTNTVPIGTLPYMSPEQLGNGERITAASDIYSMAVVACEMITGERPGRYAQRQGRWHLKSVDLPSSLSGDARKVIAKALRSDPKKRYQSAKQFGDELAAALNEPIGPELSPSRRIATRLSVVAGVLILAMLSYGIYKYFAGTQPPRPQISQTQSQGFNYWLTVQQTRDGKDYKAPYKSNGNDTFENGDKFQLNVLSLDSGYLYIFNERRPEEGSTSFRLIYPKRAVNDGSASVGGNQPIQSDWITFQGPPGTDNYWIVWSASQLTEFESAKNEAFKHPQAGLTDQNLVKVKEYLKKLDTEVNARASRMSASQEVQVRKRHDIVLTFAELKHR
jgi:serine/threonine protein kinase